jgi:hypothetical protein
MYLSVNKNYSITDCELAKAETNDCVVRSLASATEVSYRTAHKFCKDVFGREDKKGTSNLGLTAGLLKAEKKDLKIGNKTFSVKKLGKVDVKNKYKLKGEIIWRKKTLKSFMQSHPKGTYLVMVAKHCLTVVDGELLDWENNKFEPTRKVMDAYELKREDNQSVQLSLFE